MNLKNFVALAGCLTFAMPFFAAKAQTKAVLFDGILVAGYVDNGAFINCTGPSIKFAQKPCTILIGMLPGLRIKEDKVAIGAPQNEMVTPNLGFGATAIFHHIALQIPFYYNAKTAAKNGKWNIGVGLGYKF